MVLVDTSVWIRFLSNRAPHAYQLADLLSREQVVAHDFVFGELLAGDTGGRSIMLAQFALMRQAPVMSHAEVVAFARAGGLTGRGLGWVDLHLLASAVAAHLSLWTADRRLAEVATALGVGFEAPDPRPS